jgi:transketolase
MRKKFVELCKEELIQNSMSHVLLGDIGVGGFLNANDELQERVINMGIAEQAMIGFGSGLSAMMPKANVIVHTISPFLVERALEQIKLCCGYNEKKLILISANGPFDYEKLGPTHHCASDVSLLSTIPNIELRLPATVEDLEVAFHEAITSAKSFYIRMTSRSILLPVCVSINKDWKKVYIVNGELSIIKPKVIDSVLICIGESLKYCLNRYKEGSYVIYVTSNPKSYITDEFIESDNVILYEPYVMPSISFRCNSDFNHKRFNFKIENKKVIKSNLGWEDFNEKK